MDDRDEDPVRRDTIGLPESWWLRTGVFQKKRRIRTKAEAMRRIYERGLSEVEREKPEDD